MELLKLMRLVRQAEFQLNKFGELAQRDQAMGCERGCSYCCYQFVSVSPPEVFRLAVVLRQMNKRAWARGRLKEFNQQMSDATDRNQWFEKRIPCPFLVDDQCSIYRHRPLPCRSLFSFSQERCRNATAEGAGARVGYWREPQEALVTLQLGLCVEIDDGNYGYRSVPVDLFMALELVLGNVFDWAKRFDAGEDIFALARERALQLVYDEDSESGRSVRAELARREQQSHRAQETTGHG